MRQWVPAGIKEHQHRTYVMPRSNRQEAVDAFLKTGGVLLPQQVVQKNAHGVHAHRFGPGEFLLDLFGIEGGLLPHLQLVDRGFGDVIASDKPRLLRVPGIGFLLRPTRCLRTRYSRAQTGHEQRCRHENAFESCHWVDSSGNHIRDVCDPSMVQAILRLAPEDSRRNITFTLGIHRASWSPMASVDARRPGPVSRRFREVLLERWCCKVVAMFGSDT